MNLFNDFLDFTTLLQRYKVDYLIVGSYAVTIHSRPRSTQDIDFWIRPTKGNAENLIKALNEFGFTEINLSADEIIDKDQLIMFGKPPLRIDIMTSISGIGLDKAFKNKFVHDLGHINNVNFISLEDLLKNKTASNRQKGTEDLRWIKTYGKDNSKI
ncbi:MAG: nucleotidyltransferase [Ignavibacteriaceae bacterium]